MSATATLAPATTSAPEDECFTLYGLNWSDYVTIDKILDDKSKARLLYLDGSLTFLSPAYIHETSEDFLDKILLAIVVGCEIEIRPLGSTTLRKEERLAGLEGDRVYWLRENAVLTADVKELDLTIHPPPDLAIEVENTSKATDAMAIYARMGVPEVWRHDVRRGTLGFWALGGDGTYAKITSSLGFPFLTPEDVLSELKRAEESQSYLRWFAQLNDWVRDVIVPRLGQA